MARTKSSREAETDANLLASRLAYHLHCLAEDATDPEGSSLERLALGRERVRRVREIRRELVATAEAKLTPDRHLPDHTAARRPVRATIASDA